MLGVCRFDDFSKELGLGVHHKRIGFGQVNQVRYGRRVGSGWMDDLMTL